MIKIRSLFSNWIPVSKEQAQEYIAFTKDGITTMSESEKNKYINENRLKGITVEELLDIGGKA